MKPPPSEGRFVRVYGPLIRVLREMGGEGPAGEVSRRVADLVHGGTAERERVLASGGNAAQNEVAWARNNLKEAGFIDASTRGLWRLTPEGWEVDPETLWKIGRRRDIDKNKSASAQVTEVVSVRDSDAEIESSTPLLDTIQGLPPRGFERKVSQKSRLRDDPGTVASMDTAFSK